MGGFINAKILLSWLIITIWVISKQLLDNGLRELRKRRESEGVLLLI